MIENEQFKIQLEVERLREKYRGLADLNQYEIIMLALSKIDEREAKWTDGGWKCPTCGAKRKERFSHCVACGQALRRESVDIKEFAKSISGKERDYPQFTKEEIRTAEENGFVIVYGESDDLMEFRGVIDDEGGCYDGGKIFFDRNGACQFAEDEEDYPNWINAIWCNGKTDDSGKEIVWTYETDIPHETFMIYEGGEPYCRGIVFRIEDLK